MSNIAISALPVATTQASADVLPIVQATTSTTKQLSIANLFTSATLVTPLLGTVTSGVISACTSTSMVMVTPTAAPTIASATTIAPTTQITFISGVAAVVTITAPAPISAGGGTITLIPTGAFTWTAAGNIAVLGTAVVSRALTMTFDVTTTKWYPSYV